MSDQVVFWHPTLDQPLATDWFAFGNVAHGTTVTRDFRAMNLAIAKIPYLGGKTTLTGISAAMLGQVDHVNDHDGMGDYVGAFDRLGTDQASDVLTLTLRLASATRGAQSFTLNVLRTWWLYTLPGWGFCSTSETLGTPHPSPVIDDTRSCTVNVT